MSRNVLVTGSSHGIGAAVAIEFAKQGENVGITYLKSPDGAKAVQAECLKYGVDAQIFQVDLSVREQCEKLMDESRVLPGGYLYFSDILSMPELVQGMGNLIAGQYYDANVDFVLTMETKGIPVALMTAEALHVPLIIARRSSKVYEGSAVNINYVSGKGDIETMSLSRRAVREGSTALIVDDFMRGGGTARGMLSLLQEFNCKCAGMCFVMALENPEQRYVHSEKSLLLLGDIVDGQPVSVRVSDWVK